MPNLLDRLVRRLQPRPALGPSLARIVADANRVDPDHPGEHWVMAAFPPEAQPWRPNNRICPVGSRTRAAHLARPEEGESELGGAIPFDDEYFQWIDLLSAATEAGETFTFAELGAGYGRWTSRAAGAARRKGKRFRAALAEAEPRRAAWAREHMADNDISDFTLFEAGVDGEAGTTFLSVEWPETRDGAGWYGQSIGWPSYGDPQTVGEYRGHPVRAWGEWRLIEVEQVSLARILEAYDRFDLVDLDVQGSEARAIRSAIPSFERQGAAPLHRDPQCRGGSRSARQPGPSGMGSCLRDYPQATEVKTPFGDITMGGGVQSWVNPRLHRP